jgi:hypothetical protein
MASSDIDLATAEAQVERSLAFLDSVSEAEAAAQVRADAMRAKYTDLWASGVDAVREYHRNLEKTALREAQLHDLSAVLSRLQARERADEERATEMSLADVHAGFGPMAGVLPATALLGAMLGSASLFDTPSRAGVAAPSARTPDDPMPLRFHPRAAAAPAPAPAQAYPSPADTIVGRYGISAVLSPGQRVSVPTATLAAQPVLAPVYGAPAIDAAAPVLGRPAVLSPGTLTAAEQADLETALALSLSECEGADSAGGSAASAGVTTAGGSTSARAGRSADTAANPGSSASGHPAPRIQRAAAPSTGAVSTASSGLASASASRAYGFSGRMAPTVASRPAAAGGAARTEAAAHSAVRARSSGSSSGPSSTSSLRGVPVGGATTATLPAASHRHSGSSGSSASTGSGRGLGGMGPRSSGVDRALGTAEAPIVINERDDAARAGYPAERTAEGRSAGPAVFDEEAEFQRQLAEAMRLSEAEAEAASASPAPLGGGGGSTATQSSSRSRVTAPSGAALYSTSHPAGGSASVRAAASAASANSLGGAAAFRGADPVTAGLARSAYAALAAADEATRMRAPEAGQRAPIAPSTRGGTGISLSGLGLSASSAGTAGDGYLPTRGTSGPVRSVRPGGPAALEPGPAGGVSRSGISTSMRSSGAAPAASGGTAAPGAGSRSGGGYDYGAAARRI